MQILEVRDVTWKTWIPRKYSDFPCMKCRKAIATKRIKTRMDDDSITTITICDDCVSILLKKEGG